VINLNFQNLLHIKKTLSNEDKYNDVNILSLGFIHIFYIRHIFTPKPYGNIVMGLYSYIVFNFVFFI